LPQVVPDIDANPDECLRGVRERGSGHSGLEFVNYFKTSREK